MYYQLAPGVFFSFSSALVVDGSAIQVRALLLDTPMATSLVFSVAFSKPIPQSIVHFVRGSFFKNPSGPPVFSSFPTFLPPVTRACVEVEIHCTLPRDPRA